MSRNLLREDEELDLLIHNANVNLRVADSEERKDLLEILVGLRARQDGIRRIILAGRLTATEDEILNASKD